MTSFLALFEFVLLLTDMLDEQKNKIREQEPSREEFMSKGGTKSNVKVFQT